MMSRLGILDSPELRLPSVSIDNANKKVLDSVLARAGLLSELASTLGQAVVR